MSKSVLIVGASPVARAVLPCLLRTHDFTLISVADVLAAAHVLERVAVDDIVLDANLSLLSAAKFTKAKASDPRFASIAMHVLRVDGAGRDLRDLLPTCLDAWAKIDADELSDVLSAALRCVERALARP